MSSDKSLLVAYLCWAIGGVFGLHHFYLGRDKHAFITFAAFGGYFTLGLIRDLWRMPEYVKNANNDLEYLRKFYAEVHRHEKPPYGFVRHIGLMIMGNIFSLLVQYSIPRELLEDYGRLWIIFLELLLIPPAAALGVWLVGNVGRHKGCFTSPLVAAYLGTLPTLLFKVEVTTFPTLFAMIVHSYTKEWRLRPEPKKSTFKRIFILILCMALYLSLWSSWLYFNCKIEDPETKEPLKCRDAIKNFMNSPAFTNLSEAVWILIEHARHQGVSGLWLELMQEFDVSGKNSALSTLGLKEDASPQDILAQYKKLSREYHPDRERDPAMKAEKQERFIQVQEAYRNLRPIVRKSESDRKQPDQEPELSPSRDEL